MAFLSVGKVRWDVIPDTRTDERVGLGEMGENPRTVLTDDLLARAPMDVARLVRRRGHRRIERLIEIRIHVWEWFGPGDTFAEWNNWRKFCASG